MSDVYGQLGILTGAKEHRAVQRAIARMYHGDLDSATGAGRWRGEFTMRQLMALLNPENDKRRGWAIENAVWGLVCKPPEI